MTPKLFLLIAVGVGLAGCDYPKPMNRQQVIAACKECTDAGLGAAIFRNGYFETIDVQCEPKKERPR